MKKILALILLLFIAVTHGQTNKVKTTKKNSSKTISKNDTSLVEKIKIVEVNKNNDSDLVVEPMPTAVQEDETDKIYTSAGVEVQPEFPGGNDKLFSYISKNMELSDDMKENEVKGKIVASFILERDGSISNIKIIRDLGFGTGIQAERALKKMPRWNPAIQNGKKVRCSFMIPIMIYATKQ
ncbi:MAG: energy transducer TonB [Flavobacterium sp.]